jgi:peptidyl serine alpha-galactosyltransferase
MLRSRAKQNYRPGDDHDQSKKEQSNSAVSSNQTKSHHIIPVWFQVTIVVAIFFLGYAAEHYKRTRNIDPFRAHSLAVMSHHLQRSMQLGTESRPSNGASLLTQEEDEALEFNDGERYHVIFSTDCSPYQHWQRYVSHSPLDECFTVIVDANSFANVLYMRSYLVYYTAMKVRQTGHVTRIVSGCTDEEEELMRNWFRENVQYFSQRFHIHLTPTFSEVKDETGKVIGDYKFFNKPYGLKHFLENFELTGFHNGSFKNEDDIVFLIDPDMPLLRPLKADFSDERETIIAPRRRGKHALSTKVQRGIPFAQAYGLGVQWQRFDLDKIAGPGSPAKEVGHEEGQTYYPVGPPYIGTIHDMYQIALKWTEFVPKVHAQYPHLLAEMYAYCIAAAHLGLKHGIVDSLMASNPGAGGEAWPLVDKIPPEESCDFGRHPDHQKYALPSVVHLCQRYSVGDRWFFGKRKIPEDIYACETPLFIEPPSDIALKYNYKHPPNAKEPTPLSPQLINQHTFMVCSLTALLNEAATFYKRNACAPGQGNFERTRTVADLFK